MTRAGQLPIRAGAFDLEAVPRVARASVREATQFKRVDNVPFVLPSGQVWIQIVPLQTQLTVS